MAFSPYAQRPPWVLPTFDSELQDEEVNPAPPPMPQRKPMAMPMPRMPQMVDPPPDFYRVTGEPAGSGIPPMSQLAEGPMPPAPPPMPKKLTAAEQMDQMGPRPTLRPQSLGRGLLGAGIDAATAMFMPTMSPFVHREVANRIAYGKDQLDNVRNYDAKHQFLKEQSALEDKALGRQIQQETLQGNREYRTGMAADREADNARAEQQLIAGLGQEVQPGEQIDTQRNLYRDYKGKKYKTPTEFAKVEAKKQAEQADQEALPDRVTEALGMPKGAKVPPNRADVYYRLYETHLNNQGKAPEAQARSREALADQLGITGRDRQVYVATGRIERPPSVNVSLANGPMNDDDFKRAGMEYAITGVMPPLGNGSAAVKQRLIHEKNEFARNSGLTPRDMALAGAAFKGDSKSLAAFQTQRDQIASFEQTAQKNLDQFLQLASKIPDSGVPWVNTPLRLLDEKLVGGANMAAINAARQVANNEIAKVTQGGGLSGVLSDSARHEVSAYNPKDATLKQTLAVARILKSDMANRRNTMDATLNEIRGRVGAMGSQPQQAEQSQVEEWIRGADGKLVKKGGK